MRVRHGIGWILLVVGVLATRVEAAVTLPAVFSDHMVLQGSRRSLSGDGISRARR